MKRTRYRTRQLICLVCLLLGSLGLVQLSAQDNTPHVAHLSVDGAIGPATTDYLRRATAEAHGNGARLVVITMDTPGGLDAATRDIIKDILAAPVPIATYVHPAGSRAASAGTYILYGSHIAAMTPSTTLGAATPVQMGGGDGMPDIPGDTPDEREGREERAEEATDEQSENDGGTDQASEDKATGEGERAPQPSTAMERKVINDSVAFIRGLAHRHGRNAEWAERAVREAVSLTAEEALEKNVVDFVATDIQDLLAQADGLEVQLDSGPVTLDLSDLAVEDYQPDWRNELLSVLANPQVASILLLIGIYGLILEGYSPGAMVPGVVGIISLLLALYALQMLPINYAGLALIVVGGLLILAEAFVPSFGVLGIGGIIAIILGSIMLVDTDIPGMEISYTLLGSIAAFSAIILLIVLVMVGRSLRMPKVTSNQAMVGQSGRITQTTDPEGQVKVAGEIWHARSAEPLAPGQAVTVVSQDGLVLQVQVNPSEESAS